MPITRSRKAEQVAALAERLGAAENVVLLDFKGLDVPQATELRRQVRAASAEYRVVKNRLARRAVDGTPYAVLDRHFHGTTAVAYGGEDPVTLARTLVTFSKTAPALTVKAAVVQGQEIDSEGVKALAELPAKEALQATLLMLLQTPATQFVRTLQAVPRDLVSVLVQAEKKRRSDDG